MIDDPLKRFAIPTPDLDLSNPMAFLPAPILASAIEAMGSISGVTPGSVTYVATDGNSTTLHVTMRGWSPSLHDCNIEYKITVQDGKLDSDFEKSMLEAMKPTLDLQRARLNAGLKMGICRPMTESVIFNVVRNEMRHLVLDRALAVLAAESGEQLETILHDGVGKIMKSTHDGSEMQMWGNCGVAETPWGRVLTAAMTISDIDVDRPGVSFDGLSLTIQGSTIPETMMVGLPGRRMVALASVHPELDDRIILGATQSGDTIDVMLEPRLINWSGIADVVAAMADAED